MPRYRGVLIVSGILLIAVLFVALAQVRESHGRRGLIRFIPAVADTDVPEIKLPEERQKPAPPTAKTETPAAPAEQTTAPNPPAVPDGCPPPPPCESEAPCEIVLPLEPELLEPPPPPPPPPKEWPLLGPQIPDAILHALAVEDQSFLGYRPNDLVIGRIIDNRTNFQRGLFVTAFTEIIHVLVMAGPPYPAVTQKIEDSQRAAVSGKWWFPSSEKTIGEGLASLREFSAGLANGTIRIPASDENLKKLLNANILELQGSRDLFAPDAGYFEGDDLFYLAQGKAVAVLATLDAASLSFKTALAESGAGTGLDQAREWLRKAAQMSPVVVMNNDTTGSHLLMMAYYLERTDDALRAAVERLPGPDPIAK